MNKSWIIGMFLVLILAFSVSAASVSISRTEITDVKKPTAGFSHSFTISNNGTANITDLRVERVGPGLNGFNISTLPHAIGSTFVLNTAEQVSFTLTGTVPEDLTTKDTPYEDELKIYSGSTELGSIALKITAESQLKLEDVKFIVDGKSKSISEGDTRKDVLPGSTLEIEGDIENAFSDDDDIEIEDVTIEITIEKIDDEGDDDLEADEEVGDIDADDKESFSLEFEIPEDVDEGDYDVIILIEGEDSNGAKHSVEWDDVRIKVEKDKHDIVIRKASVSPDEVSCSRRISVNVGLKNQGRSDEDEVVVLIESTALEISNEDISIDEIEEGTGEDTEYDGKYTFTLSDKIKPGTYPIDIKVYYDTDTLSDSETVDLVVKKCEVEEEEIEEEEEEEEVVVVVSPPEDEGFEDEPEILTTEVIPETTEASLLQSDTYLFILMGAVGIALIVIIIMIMVLFSMKRRV
ncbi:hypothetical protein KY358_04825 [Candidatus Woesearchaeota archaeon]|nr:hypothetical protein [Candidatus Woesearchaeota archaeon]